MSFAEVFQRYLDNPNLCKNITVYSDDKVLIIKDVFPKALRHYLIIPKSPDFTRIHPIQALSNAKFHDQMKDYVELTKQLIAENLASCGLILDSMQSIIRFKQEFILSGVHSIPSLNNLHIHVITKDFHSPRLKNKKHYNSFNTPFFVDFYSFHGVDDDDDSSNRINDNDTDYSDSEDTIYSSDSEEINKSLMESLIKNTPLKCSYCGEQFGSKMAQLKSHLAVEFTNKFGSGKNCSPNQMA